MSTTIETGTTTGTQLSLGFDLSPRGPIAAAAAERKLIADIREKVDTEDFRDPWDLHVPDFPGDA